MKVRVNKMKKALCIILIIVLLPILFVNMVILIDAWTHPDEIPSFFGWKPFIVLSETMEDRINSGDLVIVKEVDYSTLKKGEIIAFKSDDIVIVHRIYDIISKDGSVEYITKGDNLANPDKQHVKPEKVEGILRYRIEKLGNLAMFIQTPIGTLIVLSIPLMLLILVELKENIKNKRIVREEEDKQKELQEEIDKLKKENEELKKVKT